MACLLAKLDQPHIDPRKPYTEIGGKDCFSGRTYDERYLTKFVSENRLPCNPTTAFLTPAFRNIDRLLSVKTEIIGRPRQLYVSTLQLLQDVHSGKVAAGELLADAIRILILIRNEKLARMEALLAGLRHGEGALPLSSERIVKLIEQHLSCKNASRLPVLVVAAAYHAAREKLDEFALPLNAHNAADLPTGALGDVEICLLGEDKTVTAYEMKMKAVTINDIDTAVQKIANARARIHNYIFITTDVIHDEVVAYAAQFYEKTGETEIVVLSCLGFIRHFLHLFHRLRMDFLAAYQESVLREPDSALSQPLKEAFLALRQAAESDE